MPKVSVVIPVYNTEKYLTQCIDSIAHQTISDIEILCVDDESTDSSISILEEYAKKDKRVKIYRQSNGGAGAARNLGLSHCTGEFVYFLDSDDFCNPTLLEVATNKAIATNADIVVFNHYRYNQVTKETELRYGLNKGWLPDAFNTFSYADIPDRIFSIINPTPWNKLYSRKFLIRTQLRFLEISTTNDITFASMTAAMANSIAYVNEALIYYRVNTSNSITAAKPGKLDNVVTAVLSLG